MISTFCVAFAGVVCLCSCTALPAPTASPQASATATLLLPTSKPTASATLVLTSTRAASPTATAAATPTAQPTSEGAVDALAVTYFPWADQPAASPMYTGEGRARVINSIFFVAPPFFGFDIHPQEQWYHVVGLDSWAVMDSELVSPMINQGRHPRDGDRILLHGHIEGDFVIASYIGFNDGTFYYYRSLLHADELRPERLPAAYDGLAVWVRGVLDATEGRGQFYVLPEGTAFDQRYLGREALVAGKLVTKERISVEVTKGIYVKDDGRYVQVVGGQLPGSAADSQQAGIIRALDWSRAWLSVETEGGAAVQIRADTHTRLLFADGTQAHPDDLAVGQRIEIVGQAADAETVSATALTILGTTTNGSTFAAYVAGPNDDLWTVSLDNLERRQITHFSTPADGLADARFSPDGVRFAFTHRQLQQSTLVVGGLIDGALREWLTQDQWQEADPGWSPDGRRLAFCRHRVEGDALVDGALWILNLRDGQVRQVTDPAPPGWRTIDPRWSPDGKHIAYGQISEDPSQPQRLYVFSFPSASQLVFEWGLDWQWSPDSTELLCTRQTPQEARARLWVLQRDGASPTWLSENRVHDHRGRWSPDGMDIAFLSRPSGSGGSSQLWIMQADGMRKLRPEGGLLASDLAWTADSQAVVFIRPGASGEEAGLWVLGRDGTGLHQLDADATALAATYREP